MKISLPEKKMFIHCSKISINWGDMDALGHVNNTMYFRYMEIARVNWLDSLGIKLGDNDQSFIIVNAFCEFLSPLTYPETLNVETFISEIGYSSLGLFHELKIAQENEGQNLIANGFVTCVWFDLKRQESIPIPNVIKDSLAPYIK